VKFSKGLCATKGHGSVLYKMDTDPWKYGYQSVFDTLVVHTVNNGCRWATTTHTRSISPGKKLQGREPKEIGGSLFKRWGMWFNSIIHVTSYPM